jgi:hypothetical protein
MKDLIATACVLVCVACTTDVPVTNGANGVGQGQSEAALERQLVPRCKQICQVIVTCPGTSSSSCECVSTEAPSNGGSTSSGDNGGTSGGATATAPSGDYCSCGSPSPMHLDQCLGECLDALGSRFLYKGEDCASAGLDLLECYSKLDCAAFEGDIDDPCGTRAAESLCPSSSSGDSSVDVPTSPTTSAPIGTVGGSGGTSSGPVGTTNPAVVTCNSGSSMGAAPVEGVPYPGPNQSLCEAELSNCTDGHTYRVTCGTTQDLVVMCQCIFDGHPQLMFQDDALLSTDPSTAACNSLATRNVGCGWSLADLVW